MKVWVNSLSAGYCFGDLTLFEGVKSLEPFYSVIVEIGAILPPRSGSYGGLCMNPPLNWVNADAEEALSQAMIEA